MDKATFRRLMDAVGGAMERPPPERDAHLAEVFAGELPLLEEARALVAQAAATSLQAVTEGMASALDRAATQALAGQDRLPERFGPYRVVRALGHGGMGTVYLGHQEEPLRRDVAIKVIRAGLADRETTARFAVERQALARMDHPAIARVYDAAVTGNGVPYFVMELVEGLPITEYCDREQLGLDDRLALFRSVCEAVQHAHQRGIIHRDLKPSNVLVATADGRPTPKVIDFGIAKAVEEIPIGEGAHTRAGTYLGTPGYMSPEQIHGVGRGVDVRSDVYSLGVILYELVSGRPPFDETTLRDAGPLEARRMILETDPPRPSRSLGTSAAAAARAQERGVSRRSLIRRLRADLDWIVMRALERDPQRRYQSALDLAQDLERYAAHRPVIAGPPGLWYRVGKFVRRHRVGVATAAVIVAALTSGATLAAGGLIRAGAEARRSAAIGGFLTDLLASVRPDEKGREVTVREVLDGAAARLRDGKFVGDLETEASLALVLGHSYESLGRYREAHALIQRSLEERRKLYAPDDRRVYDALYRYGTLLWKEGDLQAALKVRLELADLTARSMGVASLEHAESLSNLGNTYADMDKLDRAVEYLRRAVDAARRTPGREGELSLARFLNNLGSVYFDRGEFDEAAQAFQETLDIRARLLGEDNDVYAISLVNLGNARTNQGELVEAERILRRSTQLEERIFGPDHPYTAYAYSALAEALFRAGQLDEAEDYVRRALAIRMATAGAARWRVAAERRKLAEVLMAKGQPSDAEAELASAWDGLVAAGQTSTPQAQDVAKSMSRLQASLGRPAGAAMWEKRAGG